MGRGPYQPSHSRLPPAGRDRRTNPPRARRCARGVGALGLAVRRHHAGSAVSLLPAQRPHRYPRAHGPLHGHREAVSGTKLLWRSVVAHAGALPGEYAQPPGALHAVDSVDQAAAMHESLRMIRGVCVICVVALIAATGCGSGSSLPQASEEAGVDGGTEASTTTDAAHDDASSDAGCAPLPKSPCAVDSDCPAPAPPQNLELYCCGLIARGPGNCETLSLTNTTCMRGGCGGGSLECNDSNGTVGLQHMCGSPSDCPVTGQQCCTVCQGGHALSICMSTANATELGARCL